MFIRSEVVTKSFALKDVVLQSQSDRIPIEHKFIDFEVGNSGLVVFERITLFAKV